MTTFCINDMQIQPKVTSNYRYRSNYTSLNYLWIVLDCTKWSSVAPQWHPEFNALGVALPLAPLWLFSLSLRSVTAYWLCSWATLGIGSTVLVSSASVDCWWPSVPWCWPCLTSCLSRMNTVLFYIVRWSYKNIAALSPLTLPSCDSVQRWGGFHVYKYVQKTYVALLKSCSIL